MTKKKPTQIPQYPKKSFRKEKATSDELFNKKKANLQSIENLKKRKPHLYREWLAMAEAYKTISRSKDTERTSNQIDRLDADARKASKKGDYAKEFRKDQQAKNLMTHRTIRTDSSKLHPGVDKQYQVKSQRQQAHNKNVAARRKSFGIQPTTRRKVNPEGWSSYSNKLRKEAYKPLPMAKMQSKANKYTSDMKTELQKARNSRDLGDKTQNVRAFKRHHYNKDERTNKIEGILGKRRRIRQQVDMRNSDPQGYSSSRQSRSVENKAKHLKKSL